MPALGVALGRRRPVVGLGGDGVKVPIYLQREVVDLQTCVFGALYRDELEVCNRSKTALKVQLKPPPELKGYLEFSPAMGFVQARSSFAVQLKLRAAPELLERCAKHMKEGDASLIRIPVRVLVPDQLLPVVFLLQMRLTTGELRFCLLYTSPSPRDRG